MHLSTKKTPPHWIWMGFDGQKPSVARLHPTAVVGCDLERKYLVTGQILLGRLRKTYCTFIGYIIYIYISIYLWYWKALKSSRIQKFLRPPRWSQQQVKRITPGLPEVQRCASSKHETTLGNSWKFKERKHENRRQIWWWGPGDRRDVFFFCIFFSFREQEVVFVGLTQKIVILGG